MERYMVFYLDGNEHALRDLYGNQETEVWQLVVENAGRPKEPRVIEASNGLRAIRHAAEMITRPGQYVAINIDTGEVTKTDETAVSISYQARVRGLPEDDRTR